MSYTPDGNGNIIEAPLEVKEPAQAETIAEDVAEDVKQDIEPYNQQILAKLNDIHLELVRQHSIVAPPAPATQTLEDESEVTKEEDVPESVEMHIQPPTDMPKEEDKKPKKRRRAFRR